MEYTREESSFFEVDHFPQLYKLRQYCPVRQCFLILIKVVPWKQLGFQIMDLARFLYFSPFQGYLELFLVEDHEILLLKDFEVILMGLFL